jgi:hypothetical protein
MIRASKERDSLRLSSMPLNNTMRIDSDMK